MGRCKKKFKRRSNVCRKARYADYRASNTSEKNKIRSGIRRIYGLVLARLKKNPSAELRKKIKSVVTEKVTLATRNAKLGNIFTGGVLDELAELK